MMTVRSYPDDKMLTRAFEYTRVSLATYRRQPPVSGAKEAHPGNKCCGNNRLRFHSLSHRQSG